MGDQTSSSSAVYSLFEDLTTSKAGSKAGRGLPEVCELISFLLTDLGNNACTANRNTQVFYRLVSRARDVCDEIISLIVEVETQPTTDFSFTKFDRYTEMIGPLEQ